MNEKERQAKLFRELDEAKIGIYSIKGLNISKPIFGKRQGLKKKSA